MTAALALPLVAAATVDAVTDPAGDVRISALFGVRFLGDRACQDAAIDVVARTLEVDDGELQLRMTLLDLGTSRIDCGLMRFQEGPGFYHMQLLPDGCDPEFFDGCPEGSVAVTASWNARTFDPTPSCVYVSFAEDSLASECIAGHEVDGHTLVWSLPVSGVVELDTFGPPRTRAYDLAGDTLEFSGVTSVQSASRTFALVDESETTTVTIPLVD